MQAVIQIPASGLGGVSFQTGAEWTTSSPRRTFLGYTALAALMPLLVVQLISIGTRQLPAAAEVLPFLI
ncbi:MAG: hypothetical protein M3Q52_10855 [Pseudomonadota bacterium]|nr:hypothetical protein [Pseudomonadota bacterium]